MTLKLVLLVAIVINLCFTEAAVDKQGRDKSLGGADYLPCEYCHIPKDEYPTEGKMACYTIKRSSKIIRGRVEKCKTTVCQPGDPFCLPKRRCTYPIKNITVLDCKLVPRQPTKVIDQRTETYGTIYQINSPRYFGNFPYPDNMYCVWNISKKGFVTYRIVDQRLQSPSVCEGPGCNCPDSMEVTTGSNRFTLCGSTMPSVVNQVSSDGLQVKFCSDNNHNAKGILLMAYRHSNQNGSGPIMPLGSVNDSRNDSRKRRQEQEPVVGSCSELNRKVTEMSNNMSEMGCQYEYMMRMAQPGVPCPDDKTMMTLVGTHDYMMSTYQQTMSMCDGMDTMTNRMPMMNSIENCAVDYLYRTRDCAFAKRMVNSTNGELSDVARMIVENNFPIRVPKWENIPRTKC